MTTFGDQLYHLGGIPVSAGIMPFGAGRGALSLYVDADNGSDSNSGKTPATAMATVAAALAKCTSGNGDTIYLLPTFTSSSAITAAITWNKNNTHLVGLAAPSPNSRARMSAGASDDLATLMTVSAQGCVFANFRIGNFGDAATCLHCVEVTGNRNYFYNVDFQGMGHATPAAVAAGTSLKLTGAEENRFERCTIGLDTILRSAANFNLTVASSSARNEFYDCLFRCYSDDATACFISLGANGVERFLLFKDCIFANIDTIGTGTALTQAFSTNATQNGMVLLKNCTLMNTTDWETSASGWVQIDGAAPTAASSGLAVDVA